MRQHNSTFKNLLTLTIIFLLGACTSEVQVISDTPIQATQPTIASQAKIEKFELSADNRYLQIDFDQPVYGDSSKSKPVDLSCFNLLVNKKTGNVNEVDFTSITKLNDLPAAGGESKLKLNINLINTPTGDELISLDLSKDCIYSNGGVPSSEEESGFTVSPIDQSYSTLAFNWIAFNDSAETSAGNVTSFGLINSSGATGVLVKSGDNSSTGITATFTGNNITRWDLDTSPSAGTDAFDLFNGKINLSGITSYGGASDWYYQVELSGLSVGKSYAIFFYANRNNVAYAGTGASTRWSLFTLSGSSNAINTSGLGVEEVNENQVKLNSGFNTDNGALVGWSKIKTTTGNIVIKSENMGVDGPGEPYKSYGFQAFALMELTD